jgi:hypothetical protein
VPDGESDEEEPVKVRVYVIDFEIPAWVKSWGIRIGLLAVLLGMTAVAIAASPPLHVWSTGDTLQEADLNGNFKALGDRVTTLENGERVQRAQLGSDGSVASQTGTWISLVNHAGVGNYVITFAAGVFSATPTCVATASAGNQISPSIEIYSVSKNGITCNATSASKLTGDVGTSIDTGIFLICVGPK